MDIEFRIKFNDRVVLEPGLGKIRKAAVDRLQRLTLLQYMEAAASCRMVRIDTEGKGAVLRDRVTLVQDLFDTFADWIGNVDAVVDAADKVVVFRMSRIFASNNLSCGVGAPVGRILFEEFLQLYAGQLLDDKTVDVGIVGKQGSACN